MILTKQITRINQILTFFILVYFASFFLTAIQSEGSFSLNIKGYESAIAVVQSIFSCCPFDSGNLPEIILGVLISIFLASTNFIVLSSIIFQKKMKLKIVIILFMFVFFSGSYWVLSSIAEGEFLATMRELQYGYWLWLFSSLSIMSVIFLKAKNRTTPNIAN